MKCWVSINDRSPIFCKETSKLVIIKLCLVINDESQRDVKLAKHIVLEKLGNIRGSNPSESLGLYPLRVIRVIINRGYCIFELY